MDFLNSVLKLGRVLMFVCVLIAGNELFVPDRSVTVALGCLIMAVQLLMVTQFYVHKRLLGLSAVLGVVAAYMLWPAPHLYILGLVAVALVFFICGHLYGVMLKMRRDNNRP